MAGFILTVTWFITVKVWRRCR